MLDFRILGPFEVHRDGEPLSLGGRQQRALLATLTLRANELVSAERLIDELWPEDPPDTADHLVHVYVSRLRKALGDDGRDVLATRQPGYELLVPRGHRDLDRFEEHLAGARVAREEGRLDDAAASLRDAISLWRGPALADLVSESFARADAARLNELRIAAVEDLVEVELARGDPDLVPQLRSLVEEHPLRERLRGFLMVALYREGRQAEALRAYEEARSTLADELGIDPSQDLQDLYRRVLNQDPELRIERPVLRASPVADVGSATVAGETRAEAGAPAPTLQRRRRASLVVGGVLLVTLLVAGTVAVIIDGDGNGRGDGSTAEVVRLSPDGKGVLDRFPFDGTPSAMAMDGPILWIADRSARTVTRLDTRSGEEHTVSASGMPYALTAGDGNAWVIDPFGGTVTRIGGDGSPIRRSHGPVDAVFAFDSLWVLDTIDESVVRIDPDSGDPIGEPIALPAGAGPIQIAAASDAIWVLNALLPPSLTRIDPEDGLDPNPIPLYCPMSGQTCRPSDLAGDDAGLWVSIEHAGIVSVFEPDGERRRTQDALASPTQLALVPDGSWVVTRGGSTLVHLDPSGHPTGSWDAPEPILDVVGGEWTWASLAGP